VCLWASSSTGRISAIPFIARKPTACTPFPSVVVPSLFLFPLFAHYVHHRVHKRYIVFLFLTLGPKPFLLLLLHFFSTQGCHALLFRALLLFSLVLIPKLAGLFLAACTPPPTIALLLTFSSPGLPRPSSFDRHALTPRPWTSHIRRGGDSYHCPISRFPSMSFSFYLPPFPPVAFSRPVCLSLLRSRPPTRTAFQSNISFFLPFSSP